MKIKKELLLPTVDFWLSTFLITTPSFTWLVSIPKHSNILIAAASACKELMLRSLKNICDFSDKAKISYQKAAALQSGSIIKFSKLYFECLTIIFLSEYNPLPIKVEVVPSV